MISRASVSYHGEDGVIRHIFGMGGGGDFSARLLTTAARGTEKNIALQQAQALTMLPQTIAAARAYYEKHPSRHQKEG